MSVDPRCTEFETPKPRPNKCLQLTAHGENHVWVFNGEGGRFPGGVFSSRELAEEWIRTRKRWLISRRPTAAQLTP